MLKHVYAESRGSCTSLHTQPCLETQQANPNQIYSKQPNMLSNQSNNKSQLHRKILKKKKKRDKDKQIKRLKQEQVPHTRSF